MRCSRSRFAYIVRHAIARTDVRRASDLSSSRRAFIGRTAAGVAAGGLVWAAPSILTLDAAAAASCPSNTGLTWSNYATGAGSPTGTGTGSTVFATGSGTGLVNVTVAWNDVSGVGNSGGGGSLGTNFSVTADEIGGNQSGTNPANSKAWYMQMRASTAGQLMTTTFTFSKAVVGLKFSLYDIDRVNVAGANGTRWTDKVVVGGTKAGGGAALVTATRPTGSTVDITTGTSTTAANFTGTGNANIDPASSNGNGIATFTDAVGVTSVTVTYSAPAGSPYVTSNPFQFMGIGNLSWTSCK